MQKALGLIPSTGSWVWGLRRGRQENQKFQASLGYNDNMSHREGEEKKENKQEWEEKEGRGEDTPERFHQGIKASSSL